jgi:hypothetical protein
LNCDCKFPFVAREEISLPQLRLFNEPATARVQLERKLSKQKKYSRAAQLRKQ